MPRETLVDFFEDLARLRGDFLVHDDGCRSRTFTYAEVGALARAFAARLGEHGIVKGERVVFWSENRPGWVGALWGCILQGVIAVPVDYRASPDFLRRILQIVCARALLIGEETPGEEPLLQDAGVPVWRMADIEKWDSPPGPSIRPGISRDDTVEIVFTSGATAEPKGVTITHRNLLANMLPVEREIAKYRKYGRPFFPLRFLNLLPLSHLFGQAMATFIPPMLAGIVIFLRGYNPGEIARQIRERRVSVVVSVPKILDVLRGYVLHRFPESAKPPPKPSRWPVLWWRYRRVHRAFGWKFWAFIVGAAPLDADLEEFWSRVGFVVIQGYGLTETAPIVTLNHPFHARKGTVGTPIAGVEVKIAADGEILVRGDNVTAGYFQNPDASAEAFDQGWFHTGDIGEIDAEGRLLIRGRKKELIVTPEGLNVFPEDVERVLNQTPGVREAAVVGADRVHAVLVLAAGANQDEVVRLANQRLEDHQKIRGVSVWPGDALPRTEGAQKLKRNEIRQWVAAGSPPQAAASRGGLLDLLRRYAPDRNITPDTTLDELGLSSLERVELMMELEQRPDAAFEESAFASARTIADLLRSPPEPAGRFEFPRWNRRASARLLRRLALPALILPLTRRFARLTVRGLENLKSLRAPAIFAANHQSHMDTPAILAALPARWRYRLAPAMSKEYFAAHFRGGFSRERLKSSLLYYLAALCFNAFPIPQREAGVAGTLRYAGELVDEGFSLLIYPEGVRTDAGEIHRFQPGVAMMASKLELSVVPVRLRGLEKVLHKSATRPERGPVEIVFGPPIRPDRVDYAALAARIEEAVRAL